MTEDTRPDTTDESRRPESPDAAQAEEPKDLTDQGLESQDTTELPDGEAMSMLDVNLGE
jgi:hypothetical protein